MHQIPLYDHLVAEMSPYTPKTTEIASDHRTMVADHQKTTEDHQEFGGRSWSQVVVRPCVTGVLKRTFSRKLASRFGEMRNSSAYSPGKGIRCT